MYDLHTHSLLSDGALLPSEIAVRYQAAGYTAIAITDHVDYSNIRSIIPAILEFVKRWPKDSRIKVLPGIELTHLPPQQFKPLASLARRKGIKVIVAHGETPAEPVIMGTNQAALEAGIDILAHPGHITEREVLLAKKNSVFLEVTTRKGHKETDAHVVKLALEFGARLILNTDSHTPQDIITAAQVMAIARKAGLNQTQINTIYANVRTFLKKKLGYVL